MKPNAMCTIACCFLGSTLVLSGIAVAQQRAGGAFPQPTPEKQVTVTEIPGVIAAGAQWKLVWQGPDNADGLVGTKDGGILFAQEQPSTVGRLDPKDKFSIFATDTHGTGALGIDYKGRVIGIERTCSDPGGHPDQCHEPAQLIVIEKGKKHTTLASEYDGKTFWRMGELVCDSKGGVYFSDDNGTYFVNAAGKVSLVAGKQVRTNGMALSRDEKTLYVTNAKTLVAFDIKPDGTTTNQHDFAKLEGGGNGDGMTIDSEGRLSGFQCRRKIFGHHPSAKVFLQCRVCRPRQESPLRQSRGHEDQRRPGIQNSGRCQEQRQGDLQNRHDRPRLHGPPEITPQFFAQHFGDAYRAAAMTGSSTRLRPTTFSYRRPISQAMGNQQAAMTIPRTARPATPKGSTAALSQDEVRSPKR